MKAKRWLLVLLVWLWVLQPVPLQAGAAEPSTDLEYIVFYKEDAARLMEDSGAPFDLVSGEELQSLLAQGVVEAYEPDQPVWLVGEVSPYYDDAQWNLEMIGAGTSLAMGQTGEGVRVGVIDSGIAPVPGLEGRLAPGYDYVGGREDATDAMGHGTFVAGLIAGMGSQGLLGAAPGVTLVPLKCFTGTEGKVSDVVAGVFGGIDDFDCDVLNLSLAFVNPSLAMEKAVEYAEAQGVTIVSAAGNGGTALPYYPAMYDTVIGVGAVAHNGQVYSRSNHYEGVTLVAPGVNVTSLSHQGGTSFGSGTSFSTPHVSAAVAVLKGMIPSLTPKEIRDLLIETAVTTSGEPGWNAWYGYGCINLGASVEQLAKDPRYTGETPPDPIPATYRNCPKDATCVMTAFSDLKPTSWFHDGVHFVLQEGWMNGVGHGEFGPGQVTSRAMIVTILWRMAGEPAPEQAAPFADVPADEWFSQAVAWAAEQGIVQGMDSRTFAPHRPISREQMVTIIYRYAWAKGWDEPLTVEDRLDQFSDEATISFWARDPLRWAVATGRITGMEDGTLKPRSTATRAEAATLLMRFAGTEEPAA